MAIVIFVLSHNLVHVCKSNKMLKLDLENEGQVNEKKRDFRHSTENVQFQIGDFFPEF